MIARFTTSWKNVFNKVGALPSDGEELMRQCKADLENWNVTQSELIGALNGLPFCHFVEEFRTIVLEWKKNSDAPTFFNKVISEESKAKETFDKFKEVKDFYERCIKSVPGHKGLYTDIIEFIRSNNDNFTYLDKTEREKANNLQRITTDEWPMDKMRAYGKLRDELRSDIENTVESLKSEIVAAISDVYVEMEQMVIDKELNGFTLPPKGSVITRMTIGTQNIAKLRNELGEVKRRKSVRTYTPYDKPSPVLKETKTAYLPRPKNGGILHSEAEVDEYLESLRRSLMKYININEDIHIK